MVGLDYKGGDSTHFFFSVCFRWKGLRDDLLFLLEEELCGVNLCAQHCDLRITEQLLVSLGMFAHDFGSLKDCNALLSYYGPDSLKKRERIVVNTKPGQESAIERHNIQLVSFSGTEFFICFWIRI